MSKIFPTSVSCLKEALLDCESVLDIGCGPDSPIKYVETLKSKTGVEPFPQYIERAKANNTHTEYINSKIEDLDFAANSFDAVVLIEVIEHLPAHAALEVVEKAKKWSRKKVILTTPNGFINQNPIDGNIMQKHLSGWTATQLKDLGFSCFGLAGLKSLRTEKHEDTMNDDILVSIKFNPRWFWFLIAVLSQPFVYRSPKFAFGLFCIFRKESE